MTRILVVDDEAALLDLVRRYLAREQYEVLTAGDGRTALELARSAQPDLVVLDVMLPVLDGIEVCRQLRQFSDAYVIMLTARAEELDTLLGLTVGADDYLTKPFSPRELVARIKALLRRPRQTADALHTHAAPLDASPAPQRWDDFMNCLGIEQTSSFYIDNLRCGGALIVERALTRTPGAVHVYVNPAIEMAYVEYDPSLTDSDLLVAAIERAGFRAGVPSIR